MIVGAGAAPTQELRAFWSGPPLSHYEVLCLNSFLSRGQRVLLYSYDRKLRVPDGVELIDANEILPGEEVREFVYRNGERSPALFSNLFRYEMLRQLGGWYIDLDVVMMTDIPPITDLYIAQQDDLHINGAVMRFAAGAPIVAAAAIEARLGMDRPAWGAIGPALLTRLIAEHDLEHRVQPSSRAYPIPFHEVRALFLPERREELEQRTAGADFLHLWHELWRRVRIPKEYGPPEGSFLDALFRRFDMPLTSQARLPARAVESWFCTYQLTRQLERRFGDLSEIVAGFDERNRAVESAQRERDELLRSSSWRITAPLRRIVSAIRRPGPPG
jgi:hypothetical protein